MALPPGLTELFERKGTLNEDDLTDFYRSFLDDDLAREEARRILSAAGCDSVDAEQFRTAAQAEGEATLQNGKRPDSYISAVDADSSESVDRAMKLPGVGVAMKRGTDLQAIFDLADFNCDGTISPQELSGALKSIGMLDLMDRATNVSLLMSVLDTDHDGVISLDEFMSMDHLQFATFLDALRKIRKEDGIRGMLEDIWDARFSADAEIEEKDIRSILQVYGEASVEESATDAQELMDKLDARGNGVLSRDEFTSEIACRELPPMFSHTSVKLSSSSTRRGSAIGDAVELARITRKVTEDSFEHAGEVTRRSFVQPTRRRTSTVPGFASASTVLTDTLEMKRNGSAFQEMSEESIYRMHILFDLVDTDGSETIAFDEFTRIVMDETITGMAMGNVSETFLKNLFIEFDADGSGELEFHEFLRGFQDTQAENRSVGHMFAQASHDELVRQTEDLRHDAERIGSEHTKEIDAYKELEEDMEKTMEKQTHEYEGQLALLTSEERILRQKLSATSSSFEEASRLLDTREDQLATLKIENGRLHKELEETNARNIDAIDATTKSVRHVEDAILDDDLTAMEELAIAMTEIAALAKLLEESDAELSDLKDEVEAKLAVSETKRASAAAVTENLRVELADSQAKVNALAVKLSAALGNTNAHSPTEGLVAALEVELSAKDRINAKLEDDLKAADENVAAVEVDLFKEQETRTLLETQLQDALVSVKRAESDRQAAETRCAQFQVRVTDLEAEILQVRDAARIDGKASGSASRVHDAEIKCSRFERDNELHCKTIASQLNEITRLQINLAETKGMPARIRALEDEIMQVRDAAHIDEQEIKRLVKALEESKLSLDLELKQMQRVHNSVATTASPSEEFVSEGVWITLAEYAELTNALEGSTVALKDVEDALQRSSSEVHSIRTALNRAQTALADALTNGGDVEALEAQLRILQSQLTDTHLRSTELENNLADALAELEQARNDANRDNRDGFLASLQQEVDALTAEREAAFAREQICQTELDHLRQRRNASASAAYTDLLEANEGLQTEVDALTECLRKAGDGGEQDKLIEALVREIATLKTKSDQARQDHIKSLEQRINRAEHDCTGGCNDRNVTQEVKLVARPVTQTRGNSNRIIRRRFFVPQGQQLISRPSAPSAQGPSRMNIMVKVNKVPGTVNQNVVGKQAWFRLGQNRIGLVDGNNKAICAWLASSISALKLTNQTTISFLVSGELVSLACKHPHLAEKAYSSLQNIVSN